MTEVMFTAIKKVAETIGIMMLLPKRATFNLFVKKV